MDNGSHAGPGDKQGVAEAAKQETAAVAQSAVETGKDVVHEAAAQASVVATEAKDQVGAVVGQVKDEVKSQLDARGQQAAEGLRTLSMQMSSLAQGRPQESGRVGELLGEAQQRVQSYADTLQQRGPQAIVEDLTAFARRRPVLFLAAATAGGFAVGRLVRSGAAASKQSSEGRPALASTSLYSTGDDRLGIDQMSSRPRSEVSGGVQR
jgi:ElaB/YqjD/DUF883 family membrane-anchored ribosome-binding protein